MELLRTGDMQGLDALTAARPAVVRHLLGRLWDDDPIIRERAAVGIGNAAAHDLRLGLEFLRRFAWALNDESVTNGVYVIPAMAAIAIRIPDLAKPFVGQLVGALDDPGLRNAAIEALDLIERNRPELVVKHRNEIARKRKDQRRTGGRDCASPQEKEDLGEPWN